MIFFVYLALIVFAGLLLQWMIQEETETYSERLNQQDKGNITQKYFN